MQNIDLKTYEFGEDETTLFLRSLADGRTTGSMNVVQSDIALVTQRGNSVQVFNRIPFTEEVRDSIYLYESFLDEKPKIDPSNIQNILQTENLLRAAHHPHQTFVSPLYGVSQINLREMSVIGYIIPIIHENDIMELRIPNVAFGGGGVVLNSTSFILKAEFPKLPDTEPNRLNEVSLSADDRNHLYAQIMDVVLTKFIFALGNKEDMHIMGEELNLVIH